MDWLSKKKEKIGQNKKKETSERMRKNKKQMDWLCKKKRKIRQNKNK